MNRRNLIYRICWSLLILLIMEVGRQLIIPVVNLNSATAVLAKNRALQFFAYATGGQMNAPTLLSLGVAPYMTAKIIWSIVSMVDQEATRHLTERTQNLIQRGLTLLFAIAQAIQMAVMISKTMKPIKLLTEFDSTIILITVLVAGAMLVVHLTDLNIERGIGGAVLLILPTVIQNLPNMLENGVNTSDHFIFTVRSSIFLVVATLLFLVVTLFIYRGERRIEVQRTGIINTYGKSYLPIRVLPGGAMPFMFSMSIFVLPTYLRHESIDGGAFANYLVNTLFSYHTLSGILTYCVVVCLLGYGFGYMNFQPVETAKTLKESGDYIFDVAPGRDTERYLTSRLMRMIFVGNCFLVLVTAVPLIIGLYKPGYGNLSFFFSGLFILITILDNIFDQVNALYLKGQYELV
ncbi:hypothetical protein [Secundilactobacillus odoratitofui]|nr:hypothetical protein [Secundilactobacillus odoratitofui]